MGSGCATENGVSKSGRDVRCRKWSGASWEIFATGRLRKVAAPALVHGLRLRLSWRGARAATNGTPGGGEHADSCAALPQPLQSANQNELPDHHRRRVIHRPLPGASGAGSCCPESGWPQENLSKRKCSSMCQCWRCTFLAESVVRTTCPRTGVPR